MLISLSSLICVNIDFLFMTVLAKGKKSYLWIIWNELLQICMLTNLGYTWFDDIFVDYLQFFLVKEDEFTLLKVLIYSTFDQLDLLFITCLKNVS